MSQSGVSKMAAPPPLYKLFPLGPSAAQTSLDALVSAMWRRLFLGQDFGQNHWLNKIFATMSQWPEVATLQLCPYYFDQVTYRLPTREQVKLKESYNLRLHCFDSWIDDRQERQRAAERQERMQLRTNQDARPSTGIHLSRLYPLKSPNTGRSISTKDYIYLMYGCCL